MDLERRAHRHPLGQPVAQRRQRRVVPDAPGQRRRQRDHHRVAVVRLVAGAHPHAAVVLRDAVHRGAQAQAPGRQRGGHPLGQRGRATGDPVLLGAACHAQQRPGAAAAAQVEQHVQQRDLVRRGGQQATGEHPAGVPGGDRVGSARVEPAAERDPVPPRRPVRPPRRGRVDPAAISSSVPSSPDSPGGSPVAGRPPSSSVGAPCAGEGNVVRPYAATSAYIRSWVGPIHCAPRSSQPPPGSGRLSVRPPTRFRASSTRTSAPAASSASAQARPENPAPTTTTRWRRTRRRTPLPAGFTRPGVSKPASVVRVEGEGTARGRPTAVRRNR